MRLRSCSAGPARQLGLQRGTDHATVSAEMALVHRVDWDGVAAVIGGSATYAGDAQDFLAAAAGESQLPAGSLIIGESGYESL